MKHLYLLVLYGLLLFLSTRAASAQNTCSKTLDHARIIYTQGNIGKLPKILEPCLASGFSKEERLEALRLLTLAYLYSNELILADATFLVLITENPEYKPNEAVDPMELIILYNSFRTAPFLRFGAKIGTNATGVNVTRASGVNNYSLDTGGSRGEYNPLAGFQVGIVLEVPIKGRFTLASDAIFAIKAHEFRNRSLFVDSEGTPLTENVLRESLGVVSVPLSLQYRFMNNKFNPYISAGVVGNYLVYANSRASRFVTGEQEIRENTVKIKEAREPFSYAVLAGMGIKTKFKGGYILGELHYNLGLSSVSDEKRALTTSPEYYFNYHANNDDFKTNSLSFSIGYVINIYKPKKLKHRIE